MSADHTQERRARVSEVMREFLAREEIVGREKAICEMAGALEAAERKKLDAVESSAHFEREWLKAEAAVARLTAQIATMRNTLLSSLPLPADPTRRSRPPDG